MDSCFKTKTVDVQAVSTVCSIDLESCLEEPPTEEQIGCYCLQSENGDYTLHMSSKAQLTHSDANLQATMRSSDPQNPLIIGASQLAKMPAVVDEKACNKERAKNSPCYKKADGKRLIDDKWYYCTTVEGESGWITMQKRTSDYDFFRDWESYKYGFGNEDNLWWGLENVYKLCRENGCYLRIDFEYHGELDLRHNLMEDNGNATEDGKYYAFYDSFRI